MARSLGRGLSALIAENTVETKQMSVPDSGNRDNLKISTIRPGKFQPRTFFQQEELQELADSIKKNGIVQPIVVRPDPEEEGRYEIIAGERRWRASKIAGLQSVPAIIMQLDDKRALEIALVENVQRQNLMVLEEAEGYRRLMEEFDYTQEALSEVIGKSRSVIANTLRLLSLPDAVKGMLNDNKISAGHARALLGAEDPAKAAEIIVKKDLNVRQTEKLIKELADFPKLRVVKSGAKKSSRDPDIVRLEQELTTKLGLQVSITNEEEQGQVIISYHSLEEFDLILKLLEQ